MSGTLNGSSCFIIFTPFRLFEVTSAKMMSLRKETLFTNYYPIHNTMNMPCQICPYTYMRQLAEHRCSKHVFTCPVPILFTSYFQIYKQLSSHIYTYTSVHISMLLKVGWVVIVLKNPKEKKKGNKELKTPKSTRKLTQPGEKK